MISTISLKNEAKAINVVDFLSLKRELSQGILLVSPKLKHAFLASFESSADL